MISLPLPPLSLVPPRGAPLRAELRRHELQRAAVLRHRRQHDLGVHAAGGWRPWLPPRAAFSISHTFYTIYWGTSAYDILGVKPGIPFPPCGAVALSGLAFPNGNFRKPLESTLCCAGIIP